MSLVLDIVACRIFKYMKDILEKEVVFNDTWIFKNHYDINHYDYELVNVKSTDRFVLQLFNGFVSKYETHFTKFCKEMMHFNSLIIIIYFLKKELYCKQMLYTLTKHTYDPCTLIGSHPLTTITRTGCHSAEICSINLSGEMWNYEAKQYDTCFSKAIKTYPWIPKNIQRFAFGIEINLHSAALVTVVVSSEFSNLQFHKYRHCGATFRNIYKCIFRRHNTHVQFDIIFEARDPITVIDGRIINNLGPFLVTINRHRSETIFTDMGRDVVLPNSYNKFP